MMRQAVWTARAHRGSPRAAEAPARRRSVEAKALAWRIVGVIALLLAVPQGVLAQVEATTAPAPPPPFEARPRERMEERTGERTPPRGGEAGSRLRRARREALREARRGLERALPDARPIDRLAIWRAASRLPRAERRALGERLRRVDSLAPDERAALVTELEGLLARANEDVERFERNLDRWEGLSEAERDRYRDQMRRLRAMPPEERERLLEEWERTRGKRGASEGMGGSEPSADDAD